MFGHVHQIQHSLHRLVCVSHSCARCPEHTCCKRVTHYRSNSTQSLVEVWRINRSKAKEIIMNYIVSVWSLPLRLCEYMRSQSFGL